MKQNNFRFICLLFLLSLLAGGIHAQQKVADEAVPHPEHTTAFTEPKQPAAKVNYDESKVPVYTLPDVLTLGNGKKVTTEKNG